MEFLRGVVVATLVVFSLATQANEVDVKRLSTRNWILLESKNFLLLSDSSEKKSAAMLRELENFSYFMALLMGYKEKQLDNKIPFILAKNKSTFTAMGIDGDYAGIFSQTGGGSVYARADKFRASGANWGRSVVLHELTHYLMNTSSLGLASPSWFKEGSAEYFGTYTQKSNDIILGDMSILKNRFYSLLNNSGSRFNSVDTESLFKTEHDDLMVGKEWSKEEENFVQEFYARSVAVVHYLQAAPDRRKQMYQFLFALGKGHPIDKAFSAVFKMTYADLDNAVGEYISSKFMMARVFPIRQNGLNFPELEYKKLELAEIDYVRFLHSKLRLLSTRIIKDDERKKMENDFEQQYSRLLSN